MAGPSCIAQGERSKSVFLIIIGAEPSMSKEMILGRSWQARAGSTGLARWERCFFSCSPLSCLAVQAYILWFRKCPATLLQDLRWSNLIAPPLCLFILTIVAWRFLAHWVWYWIRKRAEAAIQKFLMHDMLVKEVKEVHVM
jgi:hypothetical protein